MRSKRFNPIAWPLAWAYIIPLTILFLCAVLSQVLPGVPRSFMITAGQVALLAASIVLGATLSGWWIGRKYSGRTLLIINLSSEAKDVLEKLAERLGGDKADVLRKSLGLMELAMQAHERGQAVGAADRSETLETEFTGF